MTDVLFLFIHKDQANFPIEFDYVNYKGEKSHRRALVQNIQFKASEWHPEPQWICRCLDVEKQEFRDFAMRDMTNVQAVKPER